MVIFQFGSSRRQGNIPVMRSTVFLLPCADYIRSGDLMARRSIPMIEISEVLYQWQQGRSKTKIADSLGIIIQPLPTYKSATLWQFFQIRSYLLRWK